MAATLEQRPYQRAGTEYLQREGRAILADEPGLGKTNQLLLAAEGRTLVVSPAMLQDVWMSEDPDDPGEIVRWRPDLLEEGLIEWTSYSSLVERLPDKNGRMGKVGDKPRAEYRGHWDTVILDESHYVKERDTKWTMAVKRLNTDRMFLATGTALPNWAHEIFTSIQLLHPSKAKAGGEYGSYWRWVGHWFILKENPYSDDPHAKLVGDLHPGWTWEEFALGCGLAGKWLCRRRDDVLQDLPPLTRQVINVPMTPAQAKVYKALKKELYAVVEDTGNEIISWSKGGVWTKLWKLTTGIEVEDPDFTGFSNKITALRELMIGRTHPVIVFTAFRSSAEATARALRTDGARVGVVSGAYNLSERKRTARDFRAGQYDVLVGTIATLAEGLTLTRADTAVFLERDPRPSKNEQAVRRIHRIGQDRPCVAIDLVTPGTVDANIRQLLASKSDQQMAAMKAFDAIQLV